MKKLKTLHQSSNPAQGLVEYLLIILLGALVSLGTLKLVGVDVKTLFEKAGGVFGVQEKVYLTDNFLDLKAWKVFQGQNCWKTENGILSTTLKSCDSRMMNTGNLPNDYQVTMDMAQLLSGDGYGLMFRLEQSKGSYSGYSFQIDKGYGNKFVFRRYDVNGVELGKPLAVGTPPTGFDFNAPHKVSVSVNGSNFTAYVDGVAVLSATDNTYTSGSSGLRVWDSTQAKFSGFTVTQGK
jgi:Flp pilus assembly pilin Flp